MIESIFKEIMAENFPNLRRDVDMQLHEAQRPRKSNPKKNMPRHIITKLSKIKKRKRNFESSKRKETHHKQGLSPTDPKEMSRFLSRNLAEQEGVR